MPNPSSDSAPKSRLALLLRLHESDPGNEHLTVDAAEAALQANAPEAARDIIQRFSEKAPLSPRLLSLAGLTAMRLNAFDEAIPIFTQLLAENQNDPSLKFNLAWSKAMSRDFGAALELLDNDTLAALGQAAMLKVQLLHDAGRLDEALEAAKFGMSVHPAHQGLLAAISVLAIDVEDLGLAAATAQSAGDHPDALTTLGTLALDAGNDAEAEALFARALEKAPGTPRAWIGSGLAELLTGRAPSAAQKIEHGAELFKDHIGSWIAAGWAHLFAKDYGAARAAFDRAMTIDANFSETHGSLAVLDLIEGRPAEAKRGAEKAMRLDRQSFSGALANAMLLSAAGDEKSARAIVERAMKTPIDDSGRTLAQAIAQRGLMM